jgi:site-specific DNA-methyltransferase (adenine-specific)
MNTKGIFSHQTDDWKTPKEIYDFYTKKLNYYDPCPFQSKKDGLKEEWDNDTFINPPYSNIFEWVKKACEQKSLHWNNDYVMLLPVRTDTRWFSYLSNFGCKIRFFRGRLKFNDSKNGAPFPSMLVEIGKDNTYWVISNKYPKEIIPND